MKNYLKNYYNQYCYTKYYFNFFLFYIVSVLLISCQGHTPYKEADNGLGVGERDSTVKKKAENPPYMVKFYDKTGRIHINIEISPREAFIKYESGKRYMIGRYEAGKNPIYFDEKGDIIAKIMPTDLGFIIKNNNNQNIFWIKEKDKVFLIADNQRLKNAFEIRKEKNLIRLYSPSKMIAEMRTEEDKIILKGYDVYEIRDFKEKQPNPAFLAILLNELPEYLRFIILVEMMR